MEFVFLTEEYVQPYLDFCREALETDEPENLVFDHVSEEEVRRFLTEPFYQNTKNILAVEHGKVVAQLEYHFYGVIADNYRMAYVDWVYTLKSHRKQGIAKELFRRFEEECRKHDINQYYLIQSKEAEAFYGRFEGGSVSADHIRRKNICQ